MKNNLIKGFILVFFLFTGRAAGAQGLPESAMYAHFINVGQADATLLEFPCGAILIDAGAQDTNYEHQLLEYLRNFFERRPDLNNTLDLVFVTHCHIDHNLALDSVVADFHVKEYIDNGVHTGSGSHNQLWMERNAAKLHIISTSYAFEQATANGQHQGITNDTIEPLHCSVVTPQIYVLSGRFANVPAGWSKVVYNDGNNHSLVIKVVFGRASFLFTGDLETDGIQQLLNYYAGSGALDVDVLRVGHHGSINATTAAYLNAVTPQYAVISCGRWNYGIGPPPVAFTTYTYGHPSGTTIDLLSAAVPGSRKQAVTEQVGYGAKMFRPITITKNIFATAWDGTITIEANSNGDYTVMQ